MNNTIENHKIIERAYIYRHWHDLSNDGRGGYIGQTRVGIEKRWNEHISHSRLPSTYSYTSLVSRAIRKYGIGVWKSECLEVLDNTTQSEINEREQFWIGHYNTNKGHGYNMTDGGGFTNTAKHHIIYKDKERIEVFNLQDWCRNNNLNHSAINTMLKYKYFSTSQGYNNGKEKKKYKETNTIHTLFINDTNEEIKITNLKKFCEENNLNWGCLHKVVWTKSYASSQGYNNGRDRLKTQKRTNFILFKGNERFEFNNVAEFCRVHNLDYRSISLIFRCKYYAERGEWNNGLPRKEYKTPLS